MSTTKLDPLYTIFEQHLFNFQDPNADRKTFILDIVKDYLLNARKLGLAVPQEWESQVIEELSFQVNAMLAKKIYGCMSINEYLEAKEVTNSGAKQHRQAQKKANSRYLQMKESAEEMEAQAQVTRSKLSA